MKSLFLLSSSTFILGGDFNACMSDNDSLNRSSTVKEKEFTEFVKSNNETCEIMDSFRSVVEHEGFTWNRQSCHSRLDNVFMSQYLLSRITGLINMLMLICKQVNMKRRQ